MMRYFIFIFIFLSSLGCQTVSRFVLKPKDPPTLQPPLPQPLLVDPLTDEALGEQSHIAPFFMILFSVLLICFIPYLYIKLSPAFFAYCKSTKSRIQSWHKEFKDKKNT